MINIILCSRNGERYISEQIDSILGQSYGDYIISVYDDCSTDGTKAIIRKYCHRYPEKVFLTERDVPTGGAEFNFLKAILESKNAEYYMLSDQDDVWHSDKINEMLKVMHIQNQDTPVLLHCDARVVDEDLNEISSSFVRYSGIKPQKENFSNLLLENKVTGGAVMFNHQLRKLITALPENANMHDHWLALCAAAFGNLVYIDEPLYDYRQHSDNNIGAEKGGFVKKALERIGLGDKSISEKNVIVRYNIQRAVLQANEFANVYDEFLSERQKDTIKEFVTLMDKNKGSRMFSIIKNGFFYSKGYQTFGELLLL